MSRWFFLAVAFLLGLASLLAGFRPLYLLFFTFVGSTAVAYLWSKLQGAGLDIRISALDDYPQAAEDGIAEELHHLVVGGVLLALVGERAMDQSTMQELPVGEAIPDELLQRAVLGHLGMRTQGRPCDLL